jgi:hypothetical protein
MKLEYFGITSHLAHDRLAGMPGWLEQKLVVKSTRRSKRLKLITRAPVHTLLGKSFFVSDQKEWLVHHEQRAIDMLGVPKQSLIQIH